MKSERCQTPEILKAYALGRLTDDKADALATHLADCPVCEETLAGFDDTADSFVEAVREAGDDAEDAAPAPDGLEVALQQIGNPYEHAAVPEISTAERIRDYELLEPLGHGGMGTVYRALHRSLDRIVAVKLLPGRRLRVPQAVERFRREMKAIGRLNHPSIVRATDAGEVDGTHYLAMDFVDGIDLSRLVKLTGPLPIADACEIIRQAAVALQYAHEQGLIHRDVKPGNLMLEAGAAGHSDSPPVTVKVMDLGLALFGAASEMIDELTTVGQLMGTLDYMAPEQADSSHTVDATADIYSLGATLFKLLTGNAPYETDEYRTPLKKMKALSLVDAPGIADRRSDLPDELAGVVDRMLLRDASRRPQTAQEVADSLEPFCSGQQLDELLQRGVKQYEERRVANRENEAPAEPHAAGISPPVSEKRPPNTVHQELRPPRPQPAVAGQRGGSIWRIITACAALAGMVGLAAVIWIQTDKGMLKIESASDQVPVEIRRGNEVVESLTVIAGVNKIQLRSGHYEIVLPVEYDHLNVQAGSVEIRRGDSWVARIEETPGERVEAIAMDQPRLYEAVVEPIYEGKTFDQWKRIVTTERSPDELSKAIRALCNLGRENRDQEAVEAVLQVVAGMDTRTHLPQLFGGVGGGGANFRPEILLLLTAIDQLRGLQTESVVAAVTDVLRKHDPDIMYFVATFLAPQRDWYSNANMSNYGSVEASRRDGVSLIRAFYTNDDFITLLERDFELLSEELQVNYLRFLTEDLYANPPSPRTGILTSKQRTIAVAAMNGKFGRWIQDVACTLLVRRDPSVEVAEAIISLIGGTDKNDTLNTAAPHPLPDMGNWSRRDFFRWTMLRDLCDHLDSSTELVDWVGEEDTTFGSLDAYLDTTTQRYVAGCDTRFGSFGVHSVSRGFLATDILAAMGPRVQDMEM